MLVETSISRSRGRQGHHNRRVNHFHFFHAQSRTHHGHVAQHDLSARARMNANARSFSLVHNQSPQFYYYEGADASPYVRQPWLPSGKKGQIFTRNGPQVRKKYNIKDIYCGTYNTVY